MRGTKGEGGERQTEEILGNTGSTRKEVGQRLTGPVVSLGWGWVWVRRGDSQWKPRQEKKRVWVCQVVPCVCIQ